MHRDMLRSSRETRRLSSLVILMAALALAACSRGGETPVALEPQASPTSSQTLAASATPGPPTSTPLPPTLTPTATSSPTVTPTSTPTAHPLSIRWLREHDFPGSEIIIEETLEPGANYYRYLASYLSEGLKIYALLTVPFGDPPESGWPVVVFNHGYIPPEQYRTTERYVAYVDGFARSGYIVFRSDYRGHGNSEGLARGGYGAPDYTVDVLNAVAALKRYPQADPQRIGMWGHSMGGYITLRAMVASQDIKAGVIWAGVVASYPDLLTRWRRRGSPTDHPVPPWAVRWRDSLVETFGAPEENPEFWDSISANAFLEDLSGPLQLHHGTADTSVPLEFSATLYKQIQQAGGVVEYYEYPGDNHNLSNYFTLAMQRSLAFFERHLKGEEG